MHLRALMAELERLANHFGDIGAICNDASFSHHACALRHPARARAARGRRLLRPSADDGPHRAGRRRRRSRAGRRGRRARAARRDRSALSRSSSSSTTTPPRCRTAPSPPASCSAALAQQFGAGGYVGRASRPRLRCAARRSRYPPYDRLALRRAGARRRRRQCARLDPHPRGRAEPVADRADPRRAAGRPDRAPMSAVAGEPREGIGAGRRRSAATCWSGCGIDATAGSRAAICAIRPGSSGRCWKPRSRATSSPTSRSATNRSTAPIRGTISRTASCARSCSKAWCAGR